jgi:hypothetical protein
VGQVGVQGGAARREFLILGEPVQQECLTWTVRQESGIAIAPIREIEPRVLRDAVENVSYRIDFSRAAKFHLAFAVESPSFFVSNLFPRQ